MLDPERFAERYAVMGERADLAAEMDALGSDYQANGYTTREQADGLGDVLHLRRGDVLLDLGAGCGWPGLYLAERHGCTVLSVDPVIEGCVTATERAHADALAGAAVICADASSIPLAVGSVDAVLHGDLMC